MKWIVLACVVVGLVGLGLVRGDAPALVPVAAPWEASGLDSSGVRQVVLLWSDGAVVVRALSRSEWASFQVRAEAWEWIECQMVAAAVVAPPMTANDAAALPETLARSLRRAINEASGFAVFPELAP